MNDMRAVIIPKSDQINADDLLAGPITIMVEKVSIRPGTEQPVSIHFAGDGGKPYKPCKSMARVMVHCWGPDANKYVGRSMTLYCDPKVTWGGMAVGGIRISHLSDIRGEMMMALTATKGRKAPFTVQPLKVAAQQPTTPPDLSGALSDWADEQDAVADTITDRAGVDKFQEMMKFDGRWQELKSADKARAASIKAKVVAVAERLKADNMGDEG